MSKYCDILLYLYSCTAFTPTSHTKRDGFGHLKIYELDHSRREVTPNHVMRTMFLNSRSNIKMSVIPVVEIGLDFSDKNLDLYKFRFKTKSPRIVIQAHLCDIES